MKTSSGIDYGEKEKNGLQFLRFQLVLHQNHSLGLLD